MRVGFILVVVGFLWALACTSTPITDEDCIVNGGICFTEEDMVAGACSTPLPNYGCYTGFQCCTRAYASNFANGHVIDAATGAPDAVGDTGVDAMDSGHDAAVASDAHDAALTDAAHADAAHADAAHADAAHADATTDAKKD